MEMEAARKFLQLIQEERQQSRNHLEDLCPKFADEIWRMSEAPFNDELCIVLLVAVRHQIEKNLIHRAALGHRDDEKEISFAQYKERISEVGALVLKKGLSALNQQLKLKKLDQWPYMHTLILVTNSYKHQPGSKPSKKLLEHLKKEVKRKESQPKVETNSARYGPMADSTGFMQLLSEHLYGRPGHGFVEFVESFLHRAERFLDTVKKANPSVAIKGEPVSMKPKDFSL